MGPVEIDKPKTKPIKIGDDVWIGKEATITKGVNIGNKSIVGIRTSVSGGEYPDDSIIVSNPPKIINKINREM